MYDYAHVSTPLIYLLMLNASYMSINMLQRTGDQLAETEDIWI